MATFGCLFGVIRREVYKTLPIVAINFQRRMVISPPVSNIANQHIQSRWLTTGQFRQQAKADSADEPAIEDAVNDENIEGETVEKKSDVRPVIDVQTSIKYLKSKAYKFTYNDALVWQPYRRNHKGGKPPEKTRKTCIRGGVIATGNPCPICRDEYLVLHPENVELLKQFISPYSGEVESYQKTGLCQKQHKNLLIAVQQAYDMGYIDMPLPFRHYDYQDYYPEWKSSAKEGKSKPE